MICWCGVTLLTNVTKDCGSSWSEHGSTTWNLTEINFRLIRSCLWFRQDLNHRDQVHRSCTQCCWGKTWWWKSQGCGTAATTTSTIQYLAKFIPNLSDVGAPLGKLLESNGEWPCEEVQKNSFDTLKKLVTDAPMLKFYDVKKPVTLSLDASSEGIGAVILQGGRPVVYGSWALTDGQLRYAQIEMEFVTTVYGCGNFWLLYCWCFRP